jgi:hypothetical protein
MSSSEPEEIPRSPGPITECVECRCLVHEAKLRLHEAWHDELNDRIRGDVGV